MPIYEYQCDACGHHLEVLQKIADKPLRKCPDCGKPKLRKLLSAPMFLLKGSGWYETDFKSDKETKRNLADRPEPEKEKSEAKAEAKADGKTESKDAKADAKPEPKSDKSDSAPPGKGEANKRTSISVGKPGRPKAKSLREKRR